VWEVKFSKLGEFQQLSRAFELTGHSSGVYDVGFCADSSRMVTVSKDGTWRAFNTKSKEHFFLHGIKDYRFTQEDSYLIHYLLFLNIQLLYKLQPENYRLGCL
jgi:WD40 repeat protein